MLTVKKYEYSFVRNLQIMNMPRILYRLEKKIYFQYIRTGTKRVGKLISLVTRLKETISFVAVRGIHNIDRTHLTMSSTLFPNRVLLYVLIY